MRGVVLHTVMATTLRLCTHMEAFGTGCTRLQSRRASSTQVEGIANRLASLGHRDLALQLRGDLALAFALALLPLERTPGWRRLVSRPLGGTRGTGRRRS